MDQTLEKLRAKIEANDRILKALVTLLALREPELVDDLKTIFTLARVEGSKIGQADAAVWNHVRQELAIITALAEQVEDEEPAGEGVH